MIRLKNSIVAVAILISTVAPAVAEQLRESHSYDAGFKINMGCLGYMTLVQRVDKESPADKAGLKAGDEIIAIDDRPIVGLKATKVLKLLNSPSSVINLKIIRDEELLQFSMKKDFAIPAWNEQALLEQQIKAKDQEQNIECKIASLHNLALFYAGKNNAKKSELYIAEARQLAETIWNKNDPKRAILIYRTMGNDLSQKAWRIPKVTYLGRKFEADLNELLKVTKSIRKVPKRYSIYFYKLARKVSSLNSREFYDIQITLLERAANIAMEGSIKEPCKFEKMLGPRENVGQGYGNSIEINDSCFSRYKLRDILDYYAHVLSWSKRKKEALKVAELQYDIAKKLRNKSIPNGYGNSSDLLLFFYKDQKMYKEAVSLAQQEISYLQSFPEYKDEISNFERQLRISNYLMKAGFMKEKLCKYDEALDFYTQSLKTLGTISNPPGSQIEKYYPSTTDNARNRVLEARLKCKTAQLNKKTTNSRD